MNFEQSTGLNLWGFKILQPPRTNVWSLVYFPVSDSRAFVKGLQKPPAWWNAESASQHLTGLREGHARRVGRRLRTVFVFEDEDRSDAEKAMVVSTRKNIWLRELKSSKGVSFI